MGAAASGGIFLSYRRQETEHVAGRLADRLGERFGTSRVFMDIDSIPPGADFVQAINSAVSRCDVLLAMIGPGWTDLEDDEGHRRLDDPGDFVVLEVRAALERGIPVIPVLVDGARMPRQNQLPKPLEPLATRNAVHVDAETFRSDVSVLIDALATTVPPAVAAGRTETDAPTTDRVAETAPDRARLPRRTVLRYAVGAGAVLAAGATTALVLRELQGPDGTRRTGGTISTTGTGKPLWTFETGDAVYSSPAVVGGVVHIGSTDGSLYALEAATGRQRWRYTTGGAVTSSPAMDAGLVVVGSNDQKVHAVDSTNGTGRWTFETGAALHSSPAIAQGVVYVGCRDHNLYALDLATGKLRWRFSRGDWFNSSPTVSSGVVYVGCRDHNVYAIDARTGRQRWRFTTGSTVDSSPTADGGSVYIGGDDHVVYSLSASDGSQIWRFDAKGGVDSSPLVTDGVLYVGSDDANVYAIDATTGRMRWSFATGNGIRSSPAVAGGLLYVGSRDRSLYAIDVTTGTRRWQLATDGPIDDSSPAVVDGVVYVGSLDHRVYAVRASGPRS